MVGRLLVGFVWLNLVFCVMVGRLLVGFVWLYLQFSVSWLVYFCGVRVAQSLVFCVMVGRFLVRFVWLNLQFSVSWLVDFQWGSCCSIFSFLCHGWQIFSGVRVAQSLVFCVMVGRHLVGFVWLNLQFCGMVGRFLGGFVWLNLQFSVSWLVDFQWSSCGSIFSFLCHGWQTFSGLRVAQSLVLCHGWQIFSGVRVAQSFVFCVMVSRLLVGFVWLNRQFSVSWQVDFQWGSCGSIQFSVSWLVDFQWVRVALSLVFCFMVGMLLLGCVWLNLQFSVSWLVDFQWGSCGSIFSFLCHGRQTFSGFRVAQSLVLCHGRQIFRGVRVAQSFVFFVMVGRLLVGFVWLNLQFCVMVGIFLVGFVWLNLQFYVSWLVYFQWGSCSFFCVMVGRLLVGFVWLNVQSSMSWQVNFQWGSCGSIFSFLCHGWQIFRGVRVAQSLVLCVMVDRLLVGFVWFNLVFCVMIGRHLVGFVWLKLQFSVSWQVDFQWVSCRSIFSFVSWQVDVQ